ncbi:ribonuclease H2, subunit C [Russula earlei]|uniref:Ribonuclease H2, subunit C n=1 Tax=Russula earlei TaxID=71964 RepID=A0ACC0TXM0_9AGAM|nr:ribonuclease H2, subunit C [Russula earlei]
MAPSITITNGHTNVPVRVPHLMPFHIQHTGPAPVSTYFRIRPQMGPEPPSSTLETCPASGNSQTEPPTAAADTDVALKEMENTPVASRVNVPNNMTSEGAHADAKTPAPLCAPRTGPIRCLSRSAKRFVSSFRGRTVHGVEVPLPTGYAGIVLRGDANGKALADTSKARRRRIARQRRRNPTEAEDDADGEMPMFAEDGASVRELKPSARFDSFVLWHPDIPVNEGEDEYLRSLSEWLDIAAEIHQSETLPS